MKKIWILGVIILVGIAIFVIFGQKNEQKELRTLKIGEIILNIEMADTDAEREQGLSGRDGLVEGEGMLFVFEKEGYYGFWMKDMKFPIDIVWIDKNKKIIHTEENVSPQTYPNSFNSQTPSLYVLETPAGFLGQNNIQIGDFVAF